jgi:hypothetical protein
MFFAIGRWAEEMGLVTFVTRNRAHQIFKAKRQISN